jgi:hypothetical protein
VGEHFAHRRRARSRISSPSTLHLNRENRPSRIRRHGRRSELVGHRVRGPSRSYLRQSWSSEHRGNAAARGRGSTGFKEAVQAADLYPRFQKDAIQKSPLVRIVQIDAADSGWKSTFRREACSISPIPHLFQLRPVPTTWIRLS